MPPETFVRIEISNQTRTRIPERWLREPLRRAIRQVHRRLEGDTVSVALIGTDRMRRLNRHWRGQDAPTDVLSFAPAGRPRPNFAAAGEIVIALPVAKRQARSQALALQAELSRLVVHGLLHLAGFDHQGMADLEERLRRSPR